MDREIEKELATDRYRAAAHAAMTGAGYLVEKKPNIASPKHVRNGLDLCAVSQAALVHLLIDKGLIDEVEYLCALADEAEREVVRYEKILREMLGPDVKLH